MWVPDGTWIEYTTKETFTGPRWVRLIGDLTRLPDGTFNVDLRHYVFTDKLRDETELVHATTVWAGVGVFFPDFEYRTFR